MPDLAIVIPAYKSMYFDRTLLSIANQTCQNFVLYIGDDSSPFNLKELVDLYRERIHIVYKHFDENRGQKDLVAQWERCIDLVGEEKWIWLFSDDDTMDSTCVESFYHALRRYPDVDLFHFNVIRVGEDNNIINKCSSFPEVLTIEDFLKHRLQGSFSSYVVEYVFRKSHFYDLGRFQHFDMAWGCDDATWIKLGKKGGIRSIESAMVYWRESSYNITPNFSDKNILKRKSYAEIELATWICEQAKENEIQIEISRLNQHLRTWFLRSIKARIKLLSFGMISELLSQFYLRLYNEKCPRRIIALFYIYKSYRYFMTMLKIILCWDSCKVTSRPAKITGDGSRL